MHALLLQLATLPVAQIDDLAKLVQMLKDGGPWALLAMALMAIVWLARSYVKARDDRDSAVAGMNDKLSELLKDVVTTSQAEMGQHEKILDAVERIERKVENVPQKP